MRQDAPPVPEAAVATNPSRKLLQEENVESMPLILQPFYATNTPTELPRPGIAASPTAGAIAATPSSLPSEAAMLGTSLFRQLTMRSDVDLQATPRLAGSTLQSEAAAWEQDWINQFASLNPFQVPSPPVGSTNQPAAAAGDAALVAFLQETLPEPAELDLDLEDLESDSGENGTNGGNGAGTDADGETPDSLAEAEQLGTEPEDNSLQFLRRVSVLLKPGESQFDIGLTYLISEADFPVLLTSGNVITGVDEAHFRIRELSMPLEYRYGLLKRVQVFAGVPIGWSNTQLSLDSFDAFENDGGLGDIDFGATIQLVDATATSPYMIASILATAPTGGDPFTAAIGLAPSAPSLGQGFWSIAGSLLCIQPYDPVVVFYGVGTRHYFSREFRGLELEPGAEYNYTFGLGFAVNERVTLSSRFRGAYIEEIKVDGERVFGANLEPMTMRFSATISKPCDRLVEPFVEFGLTDSSVSSFFGVTWTY